MLNTLTDRTPIIHAVAPSGKLPRNDGDEEIDMPVASALLRSQKRTNRDSAIRALGRITRIHHMKSGRAAGQCSEWPLIEVPLVYTITTHYTARMYSDSGHSPDFPLMSLALRLRHLRMVSES